MTPNKRHLSAQAKQQLAANRNLFEDYFDFVHETESPLIFHRWSLICCLGAMLGRQVWIQLGSFRIFPNPYVMLIGDPGTRKSSAIKQAKKLLAKAGYQHFSAEKTTKEKFLMDLAELGDGPGDNEVSATQVMENLFGQSLDDQEPKEVFIVADEFNDFMRCGDLEFHSMLGALWDWDDETKPYSQRLKNSKSLAIYQPTINLLGGNTHVGFSEMFPPQALGQGFLSRMLLIFSEPSGRKIAFPEEPSKAQEGALIAKLQKIKTAMSGRMTLNQRARDVLNILYNNYEGFADMRFTSYFTRRYTHLLKLCIICAASDCRMEVGINDVLLANTIMKYAEHFMPKALGEFGKARNADVSSKILTMLAKTTKATSETDIWKQVSSDLDRPEEMAKLLAGLHQAGKIQWISARDTGVKGWLIVRKAIRENELYVDYSLLREYESTRIKL